MVAILIFGYATAWSFDYKNIGLSSQQAGTGGTSGGTSGGTTGGTTGPTHGAAVLQWVPEDSITHGALTTTEFSAVRAVNGKFSFLTVSDAVAGNSDPEQGTTQFAEGESIILVLSDTADPSGGEDYYDQWFYVASLREGAIVYNIGINNFVAVQTSPSYLYTVSGGVDTGQRVHWTSGTTNYWDVGRLGIIPRTDDASLDQYLQYGGTTMCRMVDGATEVDTQGEQGPSGGSTTAGDVTLNSHVEDLKYYVEIDTNDLAWAVPQLTVEVDGKINCYKTYVIVSTNCTSISVAKFQSEGWKIVADSTLTAEKAFYKEIPAMIPASGSHASQSIDIPLDASAATASTAYSMKVWANDVQLEANVAVGAPTTSIPSKYGFMTTEGYGVAAINNDETYTVSSGAGATETLLGDWTNYS
jgi:hypothetical protein